MIDSREGVNEVQTLGLAGTRLWPRGHRKRRKGKCLLTGLTQSPSLPLPTSAHHSSQENLPFLPTGWIGKLRGLLITTGVPPPTNRLAALTLECASGLPWPLMANPQHRAAAQGHEGAPDLKGGPCVVPVDKWLL